MEWSSQKRTLALVGSLVMCFAAAGLVPGGLSANGEGSARKSVKPGINDTWKGEDTQPLVDILEQGEREIYTERASLAALAGPLPGSRVADIGSGSGFMALELARRVGESGQVVAVDINPRMLALVQERAADAGLGERISTVTCDEDSVGLEPASIDFAFVCDTYHHFEYPTSTMKSIFAAVRPGGQLVVVDFHRIEGESSDWTLEHIRAGQEVFTREIEEAGFELINVHGPPYLERNYVLRFRRP